MDYTQAIQEFWTPPTVLPAAPSPPSDNILTGNFDDDDIIISDDRHAAPRRGGALPGEQSDTEDQDEEQESEAETSLQMEPPTGASTDDSEPWSRDAFTKWREAAYDTKTGEERGTADAESRAPSPPPEQLLQEQDEEQLSPLQERVRHARNRIREIIDIDEHGAEVRESIQRRRLHQSPAFKGPLPPQRRPNKPKDQQSGLDFGLLVALAASNVALSALRAPMPEDFQQATLHEDCLLWCDAILREFEAFVWSKSFIACQLPKDRKALPCKWVFAEKLDALGNLIRRKARLVVKGFLQKEGIDYEEVFAPTGNKTTFRTMMHVGAAEDMEIEVMDFTNAFLNGDLDEEVYVQPPPGFTNLFPGQVWRLTKAMYGLKQAPRQWYKKLKETLEDMGFQQADDDPALFRRGKFWCFVYVDDMIIMTSDKTELRKFKQEMQSKFQMKELGPINHYLNLRVVRDRPNRHIYLLQDTFIKQGILKRFNMDDCNPLNTPLFTNHDLSKRTEDEAVTAEPYQSLVGAVNYAATSTRPDIAFTNGVLARFMAVDCHSSRHWTAAKHLL